MSNLTFNIVKKLNQSLGNIVRETTNYKMISRLYAKRYDKISVKSDTFLYEVRDGQNISDSPLQILLWELKNQPNSEHFVVYQTRFLEEVILGLKLSGVDINNLPNLHLVERNTPEYVDVLLSVQYLFTNSTFQSFIVIKPEQTYINTWHGTPLKKMGYAMPHGEFASSNVMRNFMMATYILSPNAHTSRIFKDDYRLDGLYNGRILELGYPRNDIFYNQALKANMRAFLNTQYALKVHQKLVLWAPTWKPEDLSDPVMEVAERYVVMYQSLNKRLGDDYQILLKVHPFVYKRLVNEPQLSRLLVDDALDPSAVLAVVDYLITDFSSIFFDFLLSDKPIIFYNDNPASYAEERGYYIPLKSLPGPFYSDIQEMADYILSNDYSTWQTRYQTFKERFVPLDDGKATERFVMALKENSLNQYALEQSKNVKKKVLFYTGGMQNNGISEALINLLNSIDTEVYDISLLTADFRSNSIFMNNFSRIQQKHRTFLIVGESSYSWRQRFAAAIARKFSYRRWLRFLYSKKAAKLNSRRLVGNQQFDIAIDFDSYVMDNGQWIASMDATKTFNVLHNDMWLEANKVVDGKLKNPKTKAYLPFWNLFDGSLSVSEATMKINDQKLKKYGYIRDSGVLTNIIDAKQILDQSRMDVEYQALNISQLGNPDAVMTNSSELTSAVFGEIDHAKQANSISLEPVTQPAKIFITNSRLSPEKNLDNLILAFIQLHNKYPEVELHIYGSDVGNYAPVLYNLVLENAATEYIKFFGYASNSFPAIQTADVFLLPSHTEGQSIALMEAMVLKKNIIASNVLANIELLGNGEYGLLTEGNDPAALLKALTVMAEGRYKRLSDFDVNAHNRKVEEQFAMLFE